MFVVKCKQLVEDEELSNSDDRADFALGKDGVWYDWCPALRKALT